MAASPPTLPPSVIVEAKHGVQTTDDCFRRGLF